MNTLETKEKEELEKMKILRFFIALSLGLFLKGEIQAYTIGAKTSKESAAQTVCKCMKTDEKITVDGKLDEDIWHKTASMKFVDITEGTDPFYLTDGKMTWDDDYLYVGFYFEEPDVRGYWAMTDEFLPDDFRLAGKLRSDEYWSRNECQIMRIDRFAKVFLDPDGDGSNYLEFQINALNNVFDAWYKQGFTDGKWNDRFRFPDVPWRCPGLITAAHIYGSINNPYDIDRGWSLEVAIPWESLKPFTSGRCPPENGDIWGGHLGRVSRDRQGGENIYWVWPFLGVKNCHLPDRYGKIIFEDKIRKFERLFAWGAKADEDFIKQAADIGVTDLIAGTELVKLCEKYRINLYPCITLSSSYWAKKYSDKKTVPLQKMAEEEEKILAELNGELYKETAPPTNSAFAPLPENWQITEEQKKLIEKMNRDDIKHQKAYQWGGEPAGKYYTGWGRNQETLIYSNMMCFHHPEVKEVLKEKIKELLSAPGIKGIAFDGMGYQNYHCCCCPESTRLYKEYCEKNNLKEDKNSLNRFSLETLAAFQNELVDYVKSVKPDAVTVNHVWPVFLPEPLYGNRLKIDYCGQTASWYFFWDPFRIASFSRIIYEEQNKYFPDVKGVAFIGYYDSKRKTAFPYKSPERVELELRSILRGGSNLLMMGGLQDLLSNPDIAAVFKRFMKSK